MPALLSPCKDANLERSAVFHVNDGVVGVGCVDKGDMIEANGFVILKHLDHSIFEEIANSAADIRR
jgi:hypothetical protein